LLAKIQRNFEKQRNGTTEFVPKPSILHPKVVAAYGKPSDYVVE
jgi:hypothetical protein